jgi:hypothetical protein
VRSRNNGTKGNPSLVADIFGDWSKVPVPAGAGTRRPAR